MLVPAHQSDAIGTDLVDIFLQDSLDGVEVVAARVADEYMTHDLIIEVELSDGRRVGLTVSTIR